MFRVAIERLDNMDPRVWCLWPVIVTTATVNSFISLSISSYESNFSLERGNMVPQNEQLTSNNKTEYRVNSECATGASDRTGRRCWRKWEKQKRQTAIVGASCQENIDCQGKDGGAFCNSMKRCACLTSYININGYCWQKRNPGESCVYQEQCTSTSHNSYCGSGGVCTCTNGRDPAMTEDGAVCILQGECPTNGNNPKLLDTSGTAVQCAAPRDCTSSSPYSTTNAMEDAYYCLCPNVDPEEPDCSSTLESYCCPRRALACIQPKDEGKFVQRGGGVSQVRWWYNSVTGECESMTYRGAGGNGNNFQSQALCESYCKTACPRGNPAYTPGGTAKGPVVTRCSSNSPCAKSQFHCVEGIAEYGICCATKAFICGPRGGVASNTLEVSPDPGDISYETKNVTRYYYASGQCLPFVYFGIGGNFNNFHTEDECRQFCSPKECTVGDPLLDASGRALRCTAGCPAKYTCQSGVCCPSADFVCSRPKIIGGCANSLERWWFNPLIRDCQKFRFSGCQGNFNNFRSYRTCMAFCGTSATEVKCPLGEAARGSDGRFVECNGRPAASMNTCPLDHYCYFDGTRHGCCPTRAKTCSSDLLDPGTRCSAPVTRWYYNSLTRLCETFTYNGCDGNSNNFATKIDCEKYCNVGGCPDGGQPFRDSSTGQYKVCGARGSECPSGSACTAASVGGVDGSYCCPTGTYVCALSADQGIRCGTSTISRYFFNAAKGTCEMFTYNGCGGNANNFASTEQCTSYCTSAGCPRGLLALRDISNGDIVTCNHNVATSCKPPGYNCVFSDLLKHGICCGSNAPAGSCPSGQTPYMDSFTGRPVQCQPNALGCPSGSSCYYSNILRTSFCCLYAPGACGNGGSVYLDPVTSQPTQCTPGLANVCDTGYRCQATSAVVDGVLSAMGYCCQERNVCGTGFSPYYVNNQLMPCTLNQSSSCPTFATCRLNAATGRSYCCVTATFSVCPVGKQPYLTQGAPTMCTAVSTYTACPAGFTCDLYPPTGSNYCCRVAAPSVASCPSPYSLLQPVTTCSPNLPRSCPSNYFCSFSASSQRYVCCGAGITVSPIVNPCPPKFHPYVNVITGQAQVCKLGRVSSGCPPNYSCHYSYALRNYYCCIALGMVSWPSLLSTDGCPFGTTAYSYQGTGGPLVCRPNNGHPCPPGYTCQRSTMARVYQCCSFR